MSLDILKFQVKVDCIGWGGGGGRGGGGHLYESC